MEAQEFRNAYNERVAKLNAGIRGAEVEAGLPVVETVDSEMAVFNFDEGDTTSYEDTPGMIDYDGVLMDDDEDEEIDEEMNELAGTIETDTELPTQEQTEVFSEFGGVVQKIHSIEIEEREAVIVKDTSWQARFLRWYMMEADYPAEFESVEGLVQMYGEQRSVEVSSVADVVSDILRWKYHAIISSETLGDTSALSDWTVEQITRLFDTLDFKYRWSTETDFCNSISFFTLADNDWELIHRYGFSERVTMLIFDVCYTKQKLELFQTYVEKFCGSEVKLFCYLKLLEASRFDLASYEQMCLTMADHKLLPCVDKLLKNETADWLRVILGHPKYGTLCSLLANSLPTDKVGEATLLDVLERYKDNVFLDKIVLGFLKKNYSSNYIDRNFSVKIGEEASEVETLAATLYGDSSYSDKVLASVNYDMIFSQIVYDMNSYGLKSIDFIKAFASVSNASYEDVYNAIYTLYLGRYGSDSSISECEYKQQLALLAVEPTAKWLEVMAASPAYETFSTFWGDYLLHKLGFVDDSVPDDLSRTVILSYGGGYNWVVTIDAILLNPALFAEIQDRIVEYKYRNDGRVLVLYIATKEGRVAFPVVPNQVREMVPSLVSWAETVTRGTQEDDPIMAFRFNATCAIKMAKEQGIPTDEEVVQKIYSMKQSSYQFFDNYAYYARTQEQAFLKLLVNETCASYAVIFGKYLLYLEEQKVYYVVVANLLRQYFKDRFVMEKDLPIFKPGSFIYFSWDSSAGTMSFVKFLLGLKAFQIGVANGTGKVRLKVANGMCVITYIR